MLARRYVILNTMNNANATFEILLNKSLCTIRASKNEMLAELAGRGLKAVKRGYTTWAVYEGKTRVGSVQEIG